MGFWPYTGARQQVTLVTSARNAIGKIAMVDKVAHAASDVGGDSRNDVGGIDEASHPRLPGDGGGGQAVAVAPLQRRGEIAGRRSVQMQQRQDRLARWGAATLVAGDLVVAAGAPVWNRYVEPFNIPLESGAAVMAVGTFLGVWLLQRHAGAGRDERNSMRDAIAAAFVVTYLVIVGWATFFKGDTERPELSKEVVGSFTVLVGVVIGGYFGADAIKQVTLINARSREQGGEVGPD